MSASIGKVTRSLLLLLVVFAAAFAQGARISPALQQQMSTLGPTDLMEVVITFNAESVTPDLVASVKGMGIRQGFYFHSLPMMGALATRDQVNALASMPGVRSVWDNTQLKWFNYEATGLTGVQRLQTDPTLQARNQGLPYSGRGIGVEIHDTGIDATHADLMFLEHVKQNVQGVTNLHAYDDVLPITWLENQPLTDSAGHGTHVAGMAGGNGARSGGKYAGAAPGADLVGYGSGVVIVILDALGGFDYALSHQAQYRIRVINNSWGSSNPAFDPDDPVNVATKKCFDKGIVVVFAAGNDGPGDDSINPYSKAPWAISVANAYKNGTLNESSSRGFLGDKQTILVDGQSWTVENRPTVAAPGTFIISTRAVTNNNTLIAGQAGPQEDVNRIEPEFLPYYTVLTGTSMASPHLAGIVALVLEANPSLGPLQVKDILQKTATNMPGYEGWEAGAGLVNAYAAVDRAARPTASYGSTLNLTRVFNSNALFQATKDPFTIDFNPVAQLSPTLNRYPFVVEGGVAQLEAKIDATGLLGQTGNTLNLVLIAPDGTEYSSGVDIVFPLFTTRAVVVPSPIPGNWTVELRGLRGDPANPTNGVALPETVQGVIKTRKSLGYTGLSDIAGHPASDSIQVAVSERLVDGDSTKRFRPDEVITRIEMADYLVMGTGVRQFLPTNGSKTFADVGSSKLPFAEAVAAKGAPLRDMLQQYRGVMLATAPGQFSPNGGVRRADVAYALVQSLGLEPQALALNGQAVTVLYNGQRIPIDDAAQIPAGMAGYVQLALDLNIMNAYFSLTQGPFDLQPTIHATFKPLQPMTRAEYAVHAVRFFTVYLVPGL